MPSSSLDPSAAQDPSRRPSTTLPRSALATPLNAVVAVSVVVALFMLANLVSFEYGRDQGIYAVVGDAVLHGGAPYKDAWDFKPPAIFFVFALAEALFGGGTHAVRIVEALGWASLTVAFALYTRRRMGDARLGLLGGALAIFVHVELEFWHTSQPESFAAVALAWALLLAERSRSGVDGASARRWRYAFGAAALSSFAGLLKPPLGGAIVVLFGVAVARGLRESEHARARAVMRALSAYALGGLAPVLAVVAFFAAHGALGDLYETIFKFAPQYTKLDFEIAKLPAYLVRAAVDLFLAFEPLLLAALLPLLPPFRAMRARIGYFEIVGIVAFVWFGVAIQGKFFAYHYATALPFVALLAAAGLWALVERFPRGAAASALRVALVVGVPIALLLEKPTINPGANFWARARMRMTALGDPAQRQAIMDAISSEGDMDARENRLLAEWIASHAPAASSVYLWGFEPSVYAASGHRAGTRYIYNVPQRVAWSQASFRRVLLAELAASRPSVIAVERFDVFEKVTGNSLDSAGALAEFPELRALVETHYVDAGSTNRFVMYARRDAAMPTPDAR